MSIWRNLCSLVLELSLPLSLKLQKIFLSDFSFLSNGSHTHGSFIMLRKEEIWGVWGENKKRTRKNSWPWGGYNMLSQDLTTIMIRVLCVVYGNWLYSKGIIS